MIFSILALLALCVSLCITNRNKSLYVQSLSCLLEAIYDFIILAYTGAVLNTINSIRTLIFINKNKFSQYMYLIILFLFETIIIVNCCFSWAGWISLLPTIGSIIRTYCLWQANMKLVRISGITTGLFYGVYYVYYNSWFMICGNIILIIVGIYSVFKNDILKKNKKEFEEEKMKVINVND